MNNNKNGRNPGIERYQRTEVLTANKETVLLMLYAGAIRFIKAAIEGTRNSDRMRKCENISRAQKIVSELRSTLNHEIGGEVSANLEALYDFMTRRLLEAVVSDDIQGLEECLHLLEDLSKAWEQAVAQLREQSPQPKV